MILFYLHYVGKHVTLELKNINEKTFWSQQRQLRHQTQMANKAWYLEENDISNQRRDLVSYVLSQDECQKSVSW